MRNSQLFDILAEVRNIVNSPSTDITWTRFGSVEELLCEIDSCIEGARRCDELILEKIRAMFAPTGLLQDIAIDNGWGSKYIELSSKIDKLI